MITYDDIKKANDTIKTTAIKGKDYAEVNQRIKAFRMVYPTGTIATEMIDDANGRCVFKAHAGYTNEDGEYILLGTGMAYEEKDSSFINKTSYIENCETSAIGRALGMCGFGIDVSVASYEEVANAIENQKGTEEPKAEPKATAKQTVMIAQLYNEAEITAICAKVNVDKISDLTVSQASNLISKRKDK